jgi:hypothetical protein
VRGGGSYPSEFDNVRLPKTAVNKTQMYQW